jgi:hypothetical protein
MIPGPLQAVQHIRRRYRPNDRKYFETCNSIRLRNQRVQTLSHNLAADQAIDHVQSFTGEGRKSQIVDQAQRHRSSDPRKCKACQNAAVEATRKQDDVSREDQAEQKPAHDPGDANDLD